MGWMMGLIKNQPIKRLFLLGAICPLICYKLTDIPDNTQSGLARFQSIEQNLAGAVQAVGHELFVGIDELILLELATSRVLTNFVDSGPLPKEFQESAFWHLGEGVFRDDFHLVHVLDSSICGSAKQAAIYGQKRSFC